MPDVLKLRILVVDRRGRAIFTDECDDARWHIDHWSLKVGLLLWKGDEELVTPIPDLQKFYKQAVAMAKATTAV